MVNNPVFQEPDRAPGTAAHWTLSSRCAAQRLAAFGPEPPRAAEDFERWSPFAPAFADGTVVLATFDASSRGYEAFDGWVAGVFLYVPPEALLEPCAFGGGGLGDDDAIDVDDFEGWLETVWAARLEDVGVVGAAFDGKTADGFEGWSPAAEPAWGAAPFDGGAAEAFAAGWPPAKTI
jgi:hypothetical protein